MEQEGANVLLGQYASVLECLLRLRQVGTERLGCGAVGVWSLFSGHGIVAYSQWAPHCLPLLFQCSIVLQSTMAQSQLMHAHRDPLTMDK